MFVKLKNNAIFATAIREKIVFLLLAKWGDTQAANEDGL